MDQNLPNNQINSTVPPLDDQSNNPGIVPTSTATNANPTSLLANIAGGNVDVAKIIKFVKPEGPKLDNFAMGVLIKDLRETQGFSDAKIIEMWLALDHAVEQGILTNDLIGAIKNDPKLLDNIK